MLVDGDTVIPESPAIVLYVVDKYRKKGLLPASLEAKANVYLWTMFAVTELEQPLWRSASTQHFLRKISACRRTLHSRKKLLALAAVLDSHLEGRRFIVGDNVTVADCVIAYLIESMP